MKKRISRDKEVKLNSEHKKLIKTVKKKPFVTPLSTQQLLVKHTQCMNLVNDFEKSKIDQLV